MIQKTQWDVVLLNNN